MLIIVWTNSNATDSLSMRVLFDIDIVILWQTDVVFCVFNSYCMR